MNEELRSATEELETSREELQSINEELTTVNQELKANVDELGLANSDLNNLMAATAIATIFLDRQLRITRYTPSAIDLFNLIPNDVGRPLADLTHRLEYGGLERDAERVLENLAPIERDVGRSGARWFLVRILPYRTTEDRIAGVVLTFIDITDLRNTRDALRTSEDRMRLEEGRLRLLVGFATAQEHERNRIARDLHDSLGHHLASLTMGFKTIETTEDCPAPVREQVRQMEGMVRNLDEEIDRLTHALRPLVLADLGLGAALRETAEVWSRETGVVVDIQLINLDSRRFSFIVETTVYRVVQEALTNVRKHAAAQQVSLVAECRPKDLRVIIEDDGNGFDTEDPGSAEPTKHLGLRGMRERAALAGGTLQVESTTSKGTTIYLTIPVTE
jgi:two-component system CheB/CheR fusion protein